MKKLAIIVVCMSIVSTASAKPKLSLPVKRALAREISQRLAISGMHPFIVVPPQLAAEAESYSAEYLRKFEDTLASNQSPLLENYLQLQQDPSIDIDGFARRIYKVAENTAKRYVQSKKEIRDGNMFYRFGLRWGRDNNDPVAKMTERQRTLHLIVTFVGAREISITIRERQGDSSSLDLYRQMSKYYKDNPVISEVFADHIELLSAFPYLNTKLTEREFNHLLNYADHGNVNYPNVSQEILKTISLTSAKERNLRGLLNNHGVSAEVIGRQLPSILDHLDDRQVVIADLSGKNELLVIPDSGRDQDVLALLKVRELQEQSAAKYLAFWQQSPTAEDVSYVLLARDSKGKWELPRHEKITDASIPMHSNVGLVDIFDASMFNDHLDTKYYMYGDHHTVNKEIFHNWLSLFKRFDINFLAVSYAQLQEPRAIYEATTQFLMTMDWSWYKFSKTIYPENSKEAALFAANYKHNLVIEYVNILFSDKASSITAIKTFRDIRAALEKEKEALSDTEKIDAIGNFLSELPSLIAKSALVSLASDALQTGSITSTKEKRELFEKAIHNDLQDDSIWNNSNLELLLVDSPSRASIFGAAGSLLQLGATDKQLRENIFTENVFNKLVEGKIVTERNLNEMRKILDEETVRKFVSNLGGLQEDVREKLVSVILQLPRLIIRDGLAKKLAKGMSSERDFLKTLRAVEENSMYRPIATNLLETSNSGERDILSKTKNILEETIVTENKIRRGYAAFVKKSPIVYFVSPSGIFTELDGEVYIPPLVKIGQVTYDEEYMQNDFTVDVDKLNEHRRFKQLFAAGIEHKVFFAASLPMVNDHKMRALMVELFGDKGVQPADPSMLAGISSGDGISEFLMLTDDVVMIDGRRMISAEKFFQSMQDIVLEGVQKALERFDAHGYVPVATAAQASSNSSDSQATHDSPQDTGFLLRELPVDLEKVQNSAKSKRTKDKNVSSSTAARAPPQKTEAQLRREAEEQARRESEEKARRELDEKITRLSHAIGRDKDLPVDTPVWLHLQALMRYMDIPPTELAKRADIMRWETRFLKITAPEATILPSKDELEAIELALSKFVNKIQVSPQRQQQMRANLQREIENIKQKLMLNTIDQARPSATAQPSVSTTSDNTSTAASSQVRLPQKGTAKKITAADVQDLLQGKLLTTYQSFSELMLVLDVSTVQELTNKLNETLEAVNAKLSLQQEERIELLSIPLGTHLVGYEHGNSNFIDRTLWKLQVIAEHIEHPQKTEATLLINAIVRAAKLQRFESVDQLNTALENNGENLRVTAEQFTKIQKLIKTAHDEWQKDWSVL